MKDSLTGSDVVAHVMKLREVLKKDSRVNYEHRGNAIILAENERVRKVIRKARKVKRNRNHPA